MTGGETQANLEKVTHVLGREEAEERGGMEDKNGEKWETKVGMKKEKQREGESGEVSQVCALPSTVVKSQPRQRLCHPSPWR